MQAIYGVCIGDQFDPTDEGKLVDDTPYVLLVSGTQEASVAPRTNATSSCVSRAPAAILWHFFELRHLLRPH